MAQEKKTHLFGSGGDDFYADELPSTENLTPAFFEGSGNYMEIPLGNAGLFGTSYPFEEQPKWRGLDPATDLDQESVRAVSNFGTYGGGSDFVDNSGGLVIGNDNTWNAGYKPQQPSKANALSSKSLSSVLAEAPRVDPPSPPGGYMEASYHMLSSGNPQMLMQACLQHLALAQVDCVAKHDQFKIKCQAFRAAARVSFTVFVWLASSDAGQKRYAVEFQRRSGCCMQFSEIYRAVKRGLAGDRLIDKVKAASIKEIPAPPPLDDVQVTVDQVRSTVKSLMNMATDKCVEMKAQGMLALAELTSSDPKVQKMMVDEGVASAMIQELSSDVVDVHRGALCGIANLSAEQESMCSAMLERGAVKTVQKLARSQHMQVVREASRLLCILGTTLGTKVVDSDFKTTLQYLRGSKDSKAREHVSSLLELLNM